MSTPAKGTVVIIGPGHPLRGGLATFDQRLATEFIREGYDCPIYSFSLQYPDFLFPGTTQYSTEPPPEGLTILSRINSINPLSWWSVCGGYGRTGIRGSSPLPTMSYRMRKDRGTNRSRVIF